MKGCVQMLLLIKKITIKIVSAVVAVALIASTIGLTILHSPKSNDKISYTSSLPSNNSLHPQNDTEQRIDQNTDPVSTHDFNKENNTSISLSNPNSPNKVSLEYDPNDSMHTISQDLDDTTSQESQLSLQDTSFIQTNPISLPSKSLDLEIKEDLALSTQINNLNKDFSSSSQSETQNSFSSKNDYEADSSQSNFEEDNSIRENKSETSSEYIENFKQVQESITSERSFSSSIKDSEKSDSNSTSTNYSQDNINNAPENIDIDMNKTISNDDFNNSDSSEMVNNNNFDNESNDSEIIKLENYFNHCINEQAKVDHIVYDALMSEFENDIKTQFTTKEKIITHVKPLSSILNNILTENNIDPFENIYNFKTLIDTIHNLIYQNHDYIASTFINDNSYISDESENVDIDMNKIISNDDFNNSDSTEMVNNNNFDNESNDSEINKLNEFFNFCTDNSFPTAFIAIRQLQNAFANDINNQRISREHLFPFIEPLSTHLIILKNTKFHSPKNIENFKAFLSCADDWIMQNYDYIASHFTNNGSNINNESKELEINKLNEYFNFCANNHSETEHIASMQLFKKFEMDIRNQRIDLEYFFLFIDPLTRSLNKFSTDSNIEPSKNIEDFKTLLNYADNWIEQSYDYIVSNFTNNNNVNDESNESESNKLNAYFNFCINNNVSLHYIAYVQLFKMFPIDMSNHMLLHDGFIIFTTPLIVDLTDYLEDYNIKPFENVDDFKALINYVDKWISDHIHYISQNISQSFTNNSSSSHQCYSSNDSNNILDQLFIVSEESRADNEYSSLVLSTNTSAFDEKITEFEDILDVQLEEIFGYSLYDAFHTIIVNTEYLIKPSAADEDILDEKLEAESNIILKNYFSIIDISYSRIYIALKKVIKEARIQNYNCKPLAQYLENGINELLQDMPEEPFKDVYEFQEFIETIDNSLDNMINNFILETIKNSTIG